MAKKPKQLCEGCSELAHCEERQAIVTFYCPSCQANADDLDLPQEMGVATEFTAVQAAARR